MLVEPDEPRLVEPDEPAMHSPPRAPPLMHSANSS